MTALELVTDAHLMTPADEAHRHLRMACNQLEADYWARADAVAEAYACEAWLRDDRAHEERYRGIMREHNLRSVFFAYVFDEFGLREGAVGYLVLAGRLRATADPLSRDKGLDWSRFTMKAVRPIGAAIIDTYEADDVATALATAQHLADKDGTARNPSPPIKPSHVRAALVEHGLVPPRAKGLSEMEAEERKAARIARARERILVDFKTLTDHDTPAAIAAIKSMVKRMSDNPTALAAIRKAVGDAAS